MIDDTETLKQREEMRAWIANTVQVSRRAVVTVADTMPYAYTVGNHLDGGRPELIMFGMSGQMARETLNLVALALRRFRGELKDGIRIKFHERAPHPVMLVDTISEARRFTPEIDAFLGARGQYRLMQVLLADPGGNYPGDPLCLDPFRRVPVYRVEAKPDVEVPRGIIANPLRDV